MGNSLIWVNLPGNALFCALPCLQWKQLWFGKCSGCRLFRNAYSDLDCWAAWGRISAAMFTADWRFAWNVFQVEIWSLGLSFRSHEIDQSCCRIRISKLPGLQWVRPWEAAGTAASWAGMDWGLAGEEAAAAGRRSAVGAPGSCRPGSCSRPPAVQRLHCPANKMSAMQHMNH